MKNSNETGTRRRFLKFVVAGAAALPAAASLLRSGSAKADDAKRLDEADPTAVVLGYKEDTTLVDAAKYPQHKPTQICEDCRYYLGKAGSERAPCAIFGGKSVHAKGWCAAYAAK